MYIYYVNTRTFIAYIIIQERDVINKHVCLLCEYTYVYLGERTLIAWIYCPENTTTERYFCVQTRV